MNRNVLIFAGGAIIITLLLLGGGLLGPLAITGYDGVESTVNEIHSPYGDQTAGTSGLGSTIVTFDPATSAIITIDANGIHMDIQEPNILSFEKIGTISKSELVTEGETTYNVTKTWDVQIAHLEMGVHLYTCGSGYGAIENVEFMIRLRENDYSVFMNPDESDAFILNVFSSRQTEQTGGSTNQVAPLAAGIDMRLDTITHSDTPQWVLDSGYTGQLTNFKDVAFPITIVTMQRHSFLGAVISEAQNKMWFGIDVLLFGYWEQWKDTRELEYDWPDWLKDLWLMLMTPLGIVLVMVAIIGTMVILWKAPGTFLKVFGVVAIWVAVIFVLIMFGVLAI